MATHKPFRFGAIGGGAGSREECAELARKVEALGYTTFLVGEHPADGGMARLIALMAAADATTTIRLGTHMLANDFRNPVLLAQEAATLDLLSGGRFELGIGTGWWRERYGISYITVLDLPDLPSNIDALGPVLARLRGR